VVPTCRLGKSRFDTDKAATGLRPSPLKATVCGLPGASSATVRVPLRFSGTVGVNVTLTVQETPAATESPQVFVWAKSPLALMLLMVSGALPLLVRVTV